MWIASITCISLPTKPTLQPPAQGHRLKVREAAAGRDRRHPRAPRHIPHLAACRLAAWPAKRHGLPWHNLCGGRQRGEGGLSFAARPRAVFAPDRARWGLPHPAPESHGRDSTAWGLLAAALVLRDLRMPTLRLCRPSENEVAYLGACGVGKITTHPLGCLTIDLCAQGNRGSIRHTSPLLAVSEFLDRKGKA